MPAIARSLATLAAVAVIAAGCGRRTQTPPVPFDQPEVALRDVRLRAAGITGGTLDVELGVYNPNGYDLEKPRVNYRILVERTEVATGYTDLDITVPSHDSVTVKLPASFSYLSLGRAGRAVLGTGSAPYRVLGRITVGTPHGRFTFPYDRAGSFSPMTAKRPR